MKRLYVILTSLIILDGIITNHLVTHGIAREGNPFLVDIAGSRSLIFVKMIGVACVIVILNDLHKKGPVFIRAITFVFIGIYFFVVFWNALVLIRSF